MARPNCHSHSRPMHSVSPRSLHVKRLTASREFYPLLAGAGGSISGTKWWRRPSAHHQTAPGIGSARTPDAGGAPLEELAADETPVPEGAPPPLGPGDGAPALANRGQNFRGAASRLTCRMRGSTECIDRLCEAQSRHMSTVKFKSVLRMQNEFQLSWSPPMPPIISEEAIQDQCDRLDYACRQNREGIELDVG